MSQGVLGVKGGNAGIIGCGEAKKKAEYEACREEVFGPRKELSSNDDGDRDKERASRESLRS